MVLKDVFDLSLDEIGEALGTTTGAIKTALHRGRTKLLDPEGIDPAPVIPAVLDAFCAAFNARDLRRTDRALLDSATMEFPGLRVDLGADAISRGPFHHTLFGCSDLADAAPPATRCEGRVHRGEPLVLWWGGDEVHAIVRVELNVGGISRLWDYHHCPEVMVELGRELGVPVKTHGYWPEGVPAERAS